VPDESAIDNEVHIHHEGTGCKFGGCVRKAVELTSGDLLCVLNSRLRDERSFLTRAAEVSRGRSSHANGEGPNGHRKGSMGAASTQRDS
jgi:hypothetical protein